MSDLFNILEDSMPLMLLAVLWVILLPLRLMALLLIPPGTRYKTHPLHALYQFFAFDRSRL